MKATIASIALLFAVVAGYGIAPAATPTAPAAVGTALPSFEGQSLDGKTVSSSQFRGKVVVLNEWATWCPPCRHETPDMVKAYNKLHASDVMFVGLDDNETVPVVKSFISEHGVPYSTILVSTHLRQLISVAAIPTTIVVDKNGIVRARWTGGVTPAQLAEFIDGARQGRNVYYVSPVQRHLDSMLAAGQFTYTGSPTQIRATAAAAVKQVAAAEAYLGSLPSSQSDSYDYAHTSREEGALQYAAATALLGLQNTPQQKYAAYSLQAKGLSNLGDSAGAVRSTRNALAIQPNDPATIFKMARAYGAAGDYTAAIPYAVKYTDARPQDPDGYSWLAIFYKRSGQPQQAIAPFLKSTALLEAAVKSSPPKDRSDNAANAADELLSLGDAYVTLGDGQQAQSAYASAKRYADMVDPKSPAAEIKDRVSERAAEGIVAVAVKQGSNLAISVTKWTGADLPGSVSSTYKYRLIVVTKGGQPVTLTAQNLAPGWVASFCADRLCSPGKVTFTPPESGVKTYEFQLVPPNPGAKPNDNIAVVSNGVTATVPAR
jgi:peroxiredoxin/tetratricopeptide (TPR) repeat protein